MNKFNGFLIALVVSLTLSACSSTRDASTSDAGETVAATSIEEEVIAQSIAAQGDTQSLHSLEWTGQVTLPQMGMTLPLKLYQKRPGMVRSEVDVEQMGATVISAYDGEVAWTINPMQTSRPQKLPEEQAVNMKDQADFDGMLVGYEDKGYEVEYLGEAEVEGIAAHKLGILRPDSSQVTLYLDADSYLPVMQTGKALNPMTGQMSEIKTYISDYRDVNGAKLPFQIEIHMNGQVFQRVKLTDVKVNEDINDDLFAFPMPGEKKSVE